MFREMRRKQQSLPLEECYDLLKNATSGVLAVSGDDDYPYAVPLSYVFDQSKIYFHCAQEGHKIDAVARNDKVSFCVIGQDLVSPQEYTTYYRSVIVFGRARLLTGETEKKNALEKIAEKYSPEEKKRAQEVDRFLKQVGIIELTIERITGKEARELTKKRAN